MRDIVTILFNEFETLDVFGPIELLGRMPQHFNPEFYSFDGGIVTSSQKVQTATKAFSEMHSESYIMLLPGGIGTRILIKDTRFVDALAQFAGKAEFILTVCTGSILFSKTGFLDGKKATSNKRVFAWIQKESPNVQWIKKARWIKDGNIYTSSGVSAGIDMTLGFISDIIGHETAKQQSIEIEYNWNENPECDPFAELY